MDFADFPRTVLEFEDRFPDERSCWVYLWNSKWPQGFRCDRCQGEKAYFVLERGLEQCAKCGRQASVTSNTLFHRARTGLRSWFRAILEFIVRKNGCNAADIRRLVGVSEPTAWRWLHKIREAMARRPRVKLRGPAEVDESYVGGPEAGVHGRNLGSKKILIVAGVEVVGHGCGRLRLAPVASAKAECLQTFVADNIEEKAEVRTDGLLSYVGLDAVFQHAVEVIGDPTTASKKFPRVHRVFSLTKRWLLGTYHGSWSKKYAPAYCAEYEFRFNRRTAGRRPLLFERVISAGLIGRPSIFRKSRANQANLAET